MSLTCLIKSILVILTFEDFIFMISSFSGKIYLNNYLPRVRL